MAKYISTKKMEDAIHAAYDEAQARYYDTGDHATEEVSKAVMRMLETLASHLDVSMEKAEDGGWL